MPPGVDETVEPGEGYELIAPRFSCTLSSFTDSSCPGCTFGHCASFGGETSSKRAGRIIVIGRLLLRLASKAA